jgi:subtilase family serine protease
MIRSPRRRVALSATLAASVAALLATASTAPSARHGRMTPAVGPVVHYKAIAAPLADPQGRVLASCQTTAPPTCFGPDQIRAAYGIQPLLDHHFDGSGSTIVIVDAYGSATIASDLRLFDRTWRLPDADLRVVAPFGVSSPPDGGTAEGWATETSLDVEWAHVVAPGAKIVLVVASSDDDADIIAATEWVLDQNAGDVLSQSYGEAESCMDPGLLSQQHALFRRMAQQGITPIASTGDSGAAQFTCDGSGYFKAVSTPASDPYVTSVGGTTLDVDGRSGRYRSETAWNESELVGDAFASGGGLSAVYSRPSYQQPVLSDQMRGLPDVAYNAAFQRAVIVAWDGGFGLMSGASEGPPQWAGLVAIADQMGHGRLGAINPALYQVGQRSRLGSLFFHDVADGSSNSIPDLTPYRDEPYGTPIVGYPAGPGYDLVTGLGSPNAAALVPWLAMHADRSGNDYGSRQGSYRWGGRRGHKHGG